MTVDVFLIEDRSNDAFETKVSLVQSIAAG